MIRFHMRHVFIPILFYIASSCIGEPVWQFAAAGTFPDRPVVSVDGSVIYAASEDRHLYAFRDVTGELIWRANIGDRPNGSLAVSPDGTILVGTRRRSLIAVNPYGDVIWKRLLSDLIIGDPAIAADGTIFVSLAGGSLVALSHRGAIRFTTTPWESMVSAANSGNEGSDSEDLSSLEFSDETPAENSGSMTQVNPGPSAGPSITGEGTVIYPSIDRNIYAFSRTGDVIWNAVLAGEPTQACIDSSGRVYVGTDFGTLVSITPDGVVAWDHREDAPFLAPVCDDAGVFAATASGVVVRLRNDGSLVWRYATGSRLRSIISADKRGTLLLETAAGTLLRVDSGGPLGSESDLLSGSTGIAMTPKGLLVAGSNDWRVAAYTSGTVPGIGWPQPGRDPRHSGSIDTVASRSTVVDLFSGDADYTYIRALLNSGSYSLVGSVLEDLRNTLSVPEGRGDYLYVKETLKEIASLGLTRIETGAPSSLNDHPDLRSRAILMLPEVAGIEMNKFLASIISYEYDSYSLASAMRAAGRIGSDPDGSATRAIASLVLDDIQRIRRDESLGYAAVDGMMGIITYHGEPRDPAGMRMLFEMFRADLSKDLRETTLEAIRSIRYY